MKNKLFALVSFIYLCLPLVAQISIYQNEELARLIKQTENTYKVIYIFCDYCYASQVRFPSVIEIISHKNNVTLFPVGAQYYTEVYKYLETTAINTPIYLINQDRKRKIVDIYNPIKTTNKFIEKALGVKTTKMGASDFIVLDEANNVLYKTNWTMSDEEYYKLLREL